MDPDAFWGKLQPLSPPLNPILLVYIPVRTQPTSRKRNPKTGRMI